MDQSFTAQGQIGCGMDGMETLTLAQLDIYALCLYSDQGYQSSKYIMWLAYPTVKFSWVWMIDNALKKYETCCDLRN